MPVFYCPGCWSEVSAGSKRCPACGRPLTGVEESYVDQLITALRHPEPTRAALAIQILSEMLAEPRAIPPLIELLGVTRDAYVLRSAVVALGRFADRRAVAPLRRVLLNRNTPLVVRFAAVDALAAIGGSAAEKAIRSAEADPCPSVRERARLVLARHGNGRQAVLPAESGERGSDE